MFKNVASQKWVVFAFDITDGSAKTGNSGQITGKINIDHAGAGAITDTNPTELEDGYYEFDLSQGETNGDHLLILPESSTGNIQVIGVPGSYQTVPPYFSSLGIASDGDLSKVNALDGQTPQTGDSFARIGAAGASLSDIGGMSTGMKAEVNAEADQALLDYDGPTSTEATQDKDEVLTRIGVAGVGLTDLGGMSTGMKAEVNAEADTAIGDYDPPTKTEMDTGHALLATVAKQDVIDGIVDAILVDTATTIPALIAALENLSSGDAQTAANAALVALHLDHLFAAAYDATSKPGAADGLLNEMVEDDGGVTRYTANALEQGPSGAGSNAYFVDGSVIQDADNEMYWTARCLKNGQPENGTACTVTLYISDGDGTVTAVAGATETVDNDDAQNVFNGAIEVELDPGKHYYLHVTMTADGDTREGMIPLGIPVRTD